MAYSRARRSTPSNPTPSPLTPGIPSAITFVNPEDDVHTFVLPDLSVALPGQTTKTVRYVTGKPGIYPFRCNMAAHSPMMSGQLVVLEPDDP